MIVENDPLQKQTKYFIEIVRKNPYVRKILEVKLFPNDISWYLGAGCLCQTVWNFLSRKEITADIKDYDLVYYDASDLSYKAEDHYIQKAKICFKNIPVEIRNQARVHLWYEKKFGKKIAQYASCEAAIDSWPTTATAVGINKVGGKFSVYAPYGLNDLFDMVIRPNKLLIEKWMYEAKVVHWLPKWPSLKIVPWD